MSRKSKFCRRRVVAVALALALTPALAGADDLEIGLFLGYRVGGELENPRVGDIELDEDLSYGLFFDIPLRDGVQLEFLWSHQEAQMDVGEGFFGSPELIELDVDYYHVGALWEWGPRYRTRPYKRGRQEPGAPEEDLRWRPFLSVTGGLAEWNPKQFPPVPPLDSETLPSFSLGGGAKFVLGDFVGLRFEGRFFGSVVGGSRDLFCAGDDCLGTVSGSVLWQFEGTVGVLINF